MSALSQCPPPLSATRFRILHRHHPACVLPWEQEEIESLQVLLEERAKHLPPEADALVVRPIFANLPPAEQLRAFEAPPPGVRKVVLATNIAEVSLPSLFVQRSSIG